MKPYNSEHSKKDEVRAMFNNIARTYDFLNRILSLGIDRRWRRKVVNLMKAYPSDNIMDIACGTGDLIIEELKLKPEKITGLDLSEEMINIARSKMDNNDYKENVEFVVADSENIPFGNNKFDIISVAFGVRNFENLTKGLSEINRVLKPGAALFILEFSMPRNVIVKLFYHLYSYVYLPFVGSIFSKDRKAYSYLPKSIREFPSGVKFEKILEECSFVDVKSVSLTFGIATIYIGHKA